MGYDFFINLILDIKPNHSSCLLDRVARVECHRQAAKRRAWMKREEDAGGEGLFLACKCQIKGAGQGSVRHPVTCKI